jgi:hypothetical protein
MYIQIYIGGVLVNNNGARVFDGITIANTGVSVTGNTGNGAVFATGERVLLHLYEYMFI